MTAVCVLEHEATLGGRNGFQSFAAESLLLVADELFNLLPLLGPAYLDGSDLACSLKTKLFSLSVQVWKTDKRPSGKRRGPTREVRQVLG